MKKIKVDNYVCEKCGLVFYSKEECLEHEKLHGEVLFIKPVYGRIFIGIKEINAYCKFGEKFYKANYKYCGIEEISKSDIELLAKQHLNSLYGTQVMKNED